MKTERKKTKEREGLRNNLESSDKDKPDRGKVNFFAKITRLFRSKEEKKLDHQKYPLW